MQNSKFKHLRPGTLSIGIISESSSGPTHLGGKISTPSHYHQQRFQMLSHSHQWEFQRRSVDTCGSIQLHRCQVSMHCQIRKLHPVSVHFQIHFQIHALARSNQKLNSGMMIQSIQFVSCQIPLNLFDARSDRRFNYVIQFMCKVWTHFLPTFCQCTCVAWQLSPRKSIGRNSRCHSY